MATQQEPLTAGILLQVLDGVQGDYLGMAEYHEERENETSNDMYRAQHEQQGRAARLAANIVREIAHDLRELLGIAEPSGEHTANGEPLPDDD